MQWEYHVWDLDTSLGVASIRDDLERWGRDGWELVAVMQHESPANGSESAAIFKRPKEDGGKAAVEDDDEAPQIY